MYLVIKYLKNDKVNNKNIMIMILRMMILNYKKYKFIFCLKLRNKLKKIMKELVKEKQNIIGQEWVKESMY